MLKKIRLDRTRTYELALATKYIATMLDAFLEGRSHFKSLGCEQGDIEKWDDLVIDLGNDVFEHIQVKRQLTPFSTLPVKRGVKAKGKKENIGDPQDLSPLDESLASLAKWSKEKNSNELMFRRFVIDVPDYSVIIKKDYQVRHFYDLCSQHINDMATEASLAALAKIDPSVKNAYTWLTTWCGFDGWGHIIKSLQLLDVRCSGLEVDLEKDTETILSRNFSDGTRTRKRINSFIDSNSSYTVAIQPRQILSELKSELRAGKEMWTQFKKNIGNWEVSGICDLQGGGIEEPGSLVHRFWNSNTKTSLKIMTLNQSGNANCKLSTPLMRFSLHFEGTSTAEFNELDTWKLQARNAVSHTLGISEDDFQSLSWSPSDLSLSGSSEYRELRLTRELEKEANCFSDAMYDVTWSKVCEVLTNKISQMINEEIRDAIEGRWYKWKSKLEINVNDRNVFLKNMLHPKSEGEDVCAELRVGPKSVNMLAEGIKFLLIVSTALYDKEDCWKTTKDGRLINTLALGYWGGPLGKPRYARELTDENGIEQLLSSELNSILIMSQIRSSPIDVLNQSLAFSLEQKDSLAISKTPDLLVTNSIRLKQLINRGTLKSIKAFFEEILKSRKLIREENIQGSING